MLHNNGEKQAITSQENTDQTKNSINLSTDAETEQKSTMNGQEKLRSQLICPVTFQVFKKPARLNCSGEHLVEEAIAIRLLKTTKKCPCCRESICSYKKDRNIEQLVDTYFELYPLPGKQKEQYSPEEKLSGDQPDEVKTLFSPISLAATTPSSSSSFSSSSSTSMLSTQHIFPPLYGDHKTSIPEVSLFSYSSSHALEVKQATQEEYPIYMPTLALRVGPGCINDRYPNQILVKVLLIGNADQGKSRFCLSLSDYTFPNSFISTIGIDFKIFQTGQYKFQVWDTAGQESFHTISSAHFRNASLILFFGDYSSWLRYVLQNVPATHLQGFSLHYQAAVPGAAPRLSFNQVEVSQTSIPPIPEHVNQQVSPRDVYLAGRQLLINLAGTLPVAEHVTGIVNLIDPQPNLQQQKCYR